MEIIITQGHGAGHTPASAFDAALLDAGIGNFNLVHIGSAIPPSSVVTATKYKAPRGQWGHRLYVVLASGLVQAPQPQIWAGLGWMQAGDGRGLFVGHSGVSQESVVGEIQASLEDLARARREKFGPIRYVLQHAEYVEEPACALVAAVFRGEAWRGNGNGGG